MKGFDRIEIKKRADAALMSDYWPLVGFTALYIGILNVSGSIAGMSSYLSSGVSALFDSPVMTVLSLFATTSIAVPVALLFSGPFQASMMWLYYRVYNGEKAKISDMFYVFRDKQRWVRTFTTVFLVNLYTILWSLLFIVPGVIKGISYSLAPYLILDDPTLTPSEAIRKSKELTMGHKGHIFGLYMSFLGWQILSGFTFETVGILWVYPYYYIAAAGIYEVLKAQPAEAAQTAEAATPFDPTTPPEAAAPPEIPEAAGEKTAKSFGIISLGHGAMSVLLSGCWGLGIPFGIAGMIMSSKSGKLGYEGSFRKAGFITSVVGSVLGAVITVIYISVIAGILSLALRSFDLSKPFDIDRFTEQFNIDKFSDDILPEIEDFLEGLEDLM